MANSPEFDVAEAHKYFSAHCFNGAWDLIDQSERTKEEAEQMIRLAHAAIWHWSQRPDATGKNYSIGYWQLSRIYTLLGETANAKKYAGLCLENTPGDLPFYLGYGYEALARAESLSGNTEEAKNYLAEARSHAENVTDAEEKKALLNDLDSVIC